MPISRAGSIDQQREALESPPPPQSPPPPPRSCLHLPPQPPETQPKHNNHQNSHHELATQQRFTWGRGGKKAEQNVARVVVALLGPCLGLGSRRKTFALIRRLPSRNLLCGKVFTYVQPRRPRSKKEKYIYIYIYGHVQLSKKNYHTAQSEKNKITVPSRLEEKYLPSRPGEGKNIYHSVPLR